MSDDQESTATDIQAIQPSVAGEDQGESRRISGWVAPVVVGLAGLVLAIGTGIGGFVLVAKSGDERVGNIADRWMSSERMPGERSGDEGHRGYSRDRNHEHGKGQGRGRADDDGRTRG